MRRGLPLVFVLLAAVGLAGCFGSSSPVDVTPYLQEFPVAPGGTVPVPLFLNSTTTFKQDLGMRMGELPQGWTYRLSTDALSVPGYKGRYVVVNVTAPQDAAAGVRELHVFAGDTRATIRVNVTAPGPALEPGATVTLSWARFDANGTLLGQGGALALAEGLKPARDATLGAAPLVVRLGGEGSPLEARLLGARVGDVLLLEGAEVPDPAFADAPGARVLLRVDAATPPEAS